MRNENELIEAIDKYGDMIRRICLVHLKNESDSEDIFQNVFLKYLQNDLDFFDSEHEKAWLIRVTINECKDLLKSAFRRYTYSLEELLVEPIADSQNREVLEAVLSLPAKYKDAIYLYYYEGYSAVEIADILKLNLNTIYSRLSRAKKILKDVLGEEEYAR